MIGMIRRSILAPVAARPAGAIPVAVAALTAGLVFVSRPILAAEVARDDVAAAVETWVREVTADARPDAVVADLEPHLAGGRIVAYIARLGAGGYCIAGADDRLVPVASYAPAGDYDPACPGHAWVLADLTARLERLDAAEAARDPILAQYREKLEQRRNGWRALIARRRPVQLLMGGQRETPVQMTLPVTSLWHQLPPFNMYCPALPLGSDEHCVVGCVGLATTQIMYYWKWPATGVGSGSTIYYYWYTTSWIGTPLANDPGPIPADLQGRLMWTVQSGGTLWMNAYWDASIRYRAEHFAENPAPEYLAALAALYARQNAGSHLISCSFATTYDWGSMHDIANDPPDPGDEEAARISYHLAVAAVSEFGLMGTGSDHPRALAALEDHFRYDTDAYSGEMTGTSGMINDIKWLRPAQMSGPGHSWMVCGYDTGVSPYQLLMNYGWPGTPLTWDTIDDIFPGNHDNILRIAPVGVVKFVGSTAAGDGSPANPYRDLAQAATQAPSGCTLIFQAATANPFAAASVVIDRPMTLRGVDVTIQPQ